jgi:hypothetical protein
MQNIIRQFIFETLESKENEARIKSRSDQLLAEPDFSADEVDADEKSEVSAVGAGAIAGVTTPLGTGPTYPDSGKKRKPAWKAASSGFGRAKPKKGKAQRT